MTELPTCCITGAIPGDGGACGDCDPCILGEAMVPEPVKRLIAEKNSVLHQVGELSDEIERMREALSAAISFCDAAIHPDGQYEDKRAELMRPLEHR